MNDCNLPKEELVVLAKACEEWGMGSIPSNYHEWATHYLCSMCGKWYQYQSEFTRHIASDVQSHVEWAWINERL